MLGSITFGLIMSAALIAVAPSGSALDRLDAAYASEAAYRDRAVELGEDVPSLAAELNALPETPLVADPVAAAELGDSGGPGDGASKLRVFGTRTTLTLPGLRWITETTDPTRMGPESSRTSRLIWDPPLHASIPIGHRRFAKLVRIPDAEDRSHAHGIPRPDHGGHFFGRDLLAASSVRAHARVLAAVLRQAEDVETTTAPDGLLEVRSPRLGWAVTIEPQSGELRRSTMRSGDRTIESVFADQLPGVALPASHPRYWRTRVIGPEGEHVLLRWYTAAAPAPEATADLLRWERYADAGRSTFDGSLVAADGRVLEPPRPRTDRFDPAGRRLFGPETREARVADPLAAVRPADGAVAPLRRRWSLRESALALGAACLVSAAALAVRRRWM